MAKRRSGSHKSASRNRIKQRRESAKRRTRIIQIVIAVLGVVILSSYAYSIISRPNADPVSQARLDDNPHRGADNPVVTLVEYGDFGCPSCKGWHEAGIFDQFLAEFGDKLQIVWRDLPVITVYSPKAAEAGQCAYDQGMFWEFHDITFMNAPDLSVTSLKGNARQINLDIEKFNQCLDSGEHKETVNYDWQAARDLGFRGTPSFAVNGQAIFGPNPDLIREFIQAAIDAAE
ncbi:MAG: thioredoxin domain-containing protein [Chloroflexi bacterium]|nr:thioredoxin domain-containing protein [Chloroflexota bacterium]